MMTTINQTLTCAIGNALVAHIWLRWVTFQNTHFSKLVHHCKQFICKVFKFSLMQLQQELVIITEGTIYNHACEQLRRSGSDKVGINRIIEQNMFSLVQVKQQSCTTDAQFIIFALKEIHQDLNQPSSLSEDIQTLISICIIVFIESQSADTGDSD